MTTTTAPVTAAGPSLPRPIAKVVLAAGPVGTLLALTHWAAGTTWMNPRLLPVAVIAALVFWSPLAVGLPAIVLGDARDQALPELRGPLGSLIRAFRLIPHLAMSPRSGVRSEMCWSLAGFAVAALYAATIL